MNAKRVAVYARVSTLDQSHESQLGECRAYCERRGWSVVGEFVDQGISGTKDRRPALDDMMTRVRRGGVDVVAVWKFSRFARSVRHLVTALEEFRALDVDFVSISEGIDTSTPVGRMTFAMVGAIDEFFVDTLRENTRAGLAVAKRKGKRLGRPRRRIDVDEARRLVAGGMSVRGAARAMAVPLRTVQRALKAAAADG
ncbi:MAG: recombinase family protein [Polyangiaceae bacterium]|nr:recombinase family protein [Polyangiaceae bacterium]